MSGQAQLPGAECIAWASYATDGSGDWIVYCMCGHEERVTARSDLDFRRRWAEVAERADQRRLDHELGGCPWCEGEGE